MPGNQNCHSKFIKKHYIIAIRHLRFYDPVSMQERQPHSRKESASKRLTSTSVLLTRTYLNIQRMTPISSLPITVFICSLTMKGFCILLSINQKKLKEPLKAIRFIHQEVAYQNVIDSK